MTRPPAGPGRGPGRLLKYPRGVSAKRDGVDFLRSGPFWVFRPAAGPAITAGSATVPVHNRPKGLLTTNVPALVDGPRGLVKVVQEALDVFGEPEDLWGGLNSLGGARDPSRHEIVGWGPRGPLISITPSVKD